jgi:hypothetical protein
MRPIRLRGLTPLALALTGWLGGCATGTELAEDDDPQDDAGTDDAGGPGIDIVPDPDAGGPSFDAGPDDEEHDLRRVRLEAEQFSMQQGVTTETSSEGGENLAGVSGGDWVAFEGVDFDGIDAFYVRVASAAQPATIEFRKDSSTGTLLATCTPPSTGGAQVWTTVSCDAQATEGTGDLYVVFTGTGESLLNVNWLELIDSATSASPGRVEAETYIGTLGIDTETCSEGGLNVRDVGDGEWAAFDVNLLDVSQFGLRVASAMNPASVQFRKGSPAGELLGTCQAPFTDGWQSWVTVTCPSLPASGSSILYLVFEGASQDNLLPNVNWFELTAAAGGEDAGVDAGEEPDGDYVALRSQNFPANVINVRGDPYDVWAEANGGDDSSFEMVAGLADATCVSFRSKRYPDRYLRHADYVLWAHPNTGGPFAGDATFCERAALSGDGAHRSFESKNFPNHYIRHYDSRLRIAQLEDNELYRADASWQLVPR